MILELSPTLRERARRCASDQGLTLEQFIEKGIAEACLNSEQRQTQRLKTALEQLLAETRRAMTPLQRWSWTNRMHQLEVWPDGAASPEPPLPRRLGSRVTLLGASPGERP